MSGRVGRFFYDQITRKSVECGAILSGTDVSCLYKYYIETDVCGIFAVVLNFPSFQKPIYFHFMHIKNIIQSTVRDKSLSRTLVLKRDRLKASRQGILYFSVKTYRMK